MRHSVSFTVRSILGSLVSIGVGFGAEAVVNKITDDNIIAGTAAYMATALPCQHVLNKFNQKIENEMLIREGIIELLDGYTGGDFIDAKVELALSRACKKHHIQSALIEHGLYKTLIESIKVGAVTALQQAAKEVANEA